MSLSARIGVAALAILCSAGCRTVSHVQAKQQAEERWSEVRGRVKLQLARQQSEGGLFKEAAATLGESIALSPGCVEAYVLLARANLELGKSASAQQAVEAAMKSSLSSAELYYTRGVILEQREAYEAALDDYAKARELNPGSVDSLVAQAECLVSLGRTSEAEELLESNLHRFDDSATVAVLTARVAELAGHGGRAVELLERASIEASEDRRIAEDLGVRLARLGRCAEALSLLEPIADGDACGGAVRRATARCHLEAGEAPRAREVLTDYAAGHPADASAQLLLAQACLETDDPWSAGRALELAREQRGDAAEVRLTQAALHWRRAEFPMAAEMLYTLLEQDPDFGPAYTLLAEVLAAQGQPEAAADCRDRAAVTVSNRPGKPPGRVPG